MFYKYLLPILAVVGALFGIYVAFWSQKVVPTAPIEFPPPMSPYVRSIAGAGLIEASSQNVAVGSPFDEVIEKVYVVEGDMVQKGDILFQLDLRNFMAQLDVAKANLEAAKISLASSYTQYSYYERLVDKKAVSEQTYQQYHFAFLEAIENVKVAEENVRLTQTNIDRSIIRAPVSGKILQVNIHEGEIAPILPVANSQSTWMVLQQGSLILMGTVDPLQVRVDIDEEDSWRYKAGAAATAFVRGNSHINFPMTFVRIEPYMIPKSSFTGETAERVDTRVLQVLYNFNKGDLPVYAGEVLDIFIEDKQAASK